MMIHPAVRGFYDQATATWSYVVWSENSTDKHSTNKHSTNKHSTNKHSTNKYCAIIDSVLDFDLTSARTQTVSADKIIAFVRDNALQVQWILETHIHADHLTAAQYLQQKFGGKTAMSQHILAVLATWEPIFQNKTDTPQDGSQFDYLFAPDEHFMIGDLPAQMIATPGHTPADSSYIIGDAAFVGDTVFLPDNGTGRCDFPGGDAGQSYDSVQKILALPALTRVYVGHDYPVGRSPQCMATVAEQKLANSRVHDGIDRASFVAKRLKDDAGKTVPKLLLPSLQVNLRAGRLGQNPDGHNFIKLPLDAI